MRNGGAVGRLPETPPAREFLLVDTSAVEYVATSQCGQDVPYLREIFTDVAVPQIAPTCTAVEEHNLACIAMSANPLPHLSDASKLAAWISVDILFVRWCKLADLS